MRSSAACLCISIMTLEGWKVRLRACWSAGINGGHFRTAAQTEDLQDFCELLSFAERALGDVFRNAGEVDFSEITRAAIDALGTPEKPSDLLYWLDYRIEHLLVDEFQDTSYSQFRLLKALTEQWSRWRWPDAIRGWRSDAEYLPIPRGGGRVVPPVLASRAVGFGENCIRFGSL